MIFGKHLARAQRFDMAAMFLSQSDKNIVGEIFASLANSVEPHQVFLRLFRLEPTESLLQDLPVAVCASRDIQHKENCHQ
ncbi:unnamed protein product [Clavelina lepadiformis]|uniref:Uncharacterized protein n=1 Tax=Clavelina lepadiformis TaxID=159417 RepID=A0ABP0G600_CLALP